LSVEDELKRLALEREAAFESALDALDLDPPDLLLRHMRAYLSEQMDRYRIIRRSEKLIHLSAQPDGIQELVCDAVHFTSESKLDFKVRMTKRQKGWRINQFKFHLRPPAERK
jgi:hypothetical protein